jgi:hypothetical protein
MKWPFGKAICEWCGGATIFRPFVNLISEWRRYSSNGFANETPRFSGYP